jgi:hypothetical protein
VEREAATWLSLHHRPIELASDVLFNPMTAIASSGQRTGCAGRRRCLALSGLIGMDAPTSKLLPGMTASVPAIDVVAPLPVVIIAVTEVAKDYHLAASSTAIRSSSVPAVDYGCPLNLAESLTAESEILAPAIVLVVGFGWQGRNSNRIGPPPKAGPTCIR